MEIDIEEIKKNKKIEELLNFGILNIDKPAGMTSFDVSDFVRKKLGINKTSHAGTLDPQVTGVLPILLGRACKLLGWFLKKDKTYIGIMRLHKDIDEKELKKEMKKFTGKIMQLPPVRSRVKREEREREVYFWNILEKSEKNVLFIVKCEAGTYIRKIISDLGENIGGAHMAELRRTEAGIFTERDKNFVNLYDFEKAVEDFRNGNEESLRNLIFPAEIISKILPVVKIKEDNLKQILTGKPIFQDEIISGVKEGSNVVFCGKKFIGIYKKVENELKSEFVMN